MNEIALALEPTSRTSAMGELGLGEDWFMHFCWKMLQHCVVATPHGGKCGYISSLHTIPYSINQSSSDRSQQFPFISSTWVPPEGPPGP